MKQSNQKALVIQIPDANPEVLKQQMQGDVGALIRWYSTSDGRQHKDGASLYRWGRFLEALSEVEE